MTSIGWEFYGVKFSLFITVLAAIGVFLSVWLGSVRREHFSHVDTMAGDEGED